MNEDFLEVTINNKEDSPDKMINNGMDSIDREDSSIEKVINNDMDSIDREDSSFEKVINNDMDSIDFEDSSIEKVINNDMDSIDFEDSSIEKVINNDMDSIDFEDSSPDKVINNNMDSSTNGEDYMGSQQVDTIDLLHDEDSPAPEHFEDSQVDTPYEHSLGHCSEVDELMYDTKKNDGNSPSKETALDSQDSSHGEGETIPGQGSCADSVVPDSLDPSLSDLPNHGAGLTEKEIRAIRMKRVSSKRWHEKWESKGVLKVPKGSNAKSFKAVPKASAAKSQAKPAPPTPAAAAPRPENFENLQAARDWFVSDWISRSDMPQSNARRQAALKAWMDSPLRSEVVALRLGIQK